MSRRGGQATAVVNSDAAKLPMIAEVLAGSGWEVGVALGRIVALHHRSSALYQIR